jgi:hypothetical protein
MLSWNTLYILRFVLYILLKIKLLTMANAKTHFIFSEWKKHKQLFRHFWIHLSMLKASSYLNLFFNQIPRVFACNSNTLFYFHLCVLRFLNIVWVIWVLLFNNFRCFTVSFTNTMHASFIVFATLILSLNYWTFWHCK